MFDDFTVVSVFFFFTSANNVEMLKIKIPGNAWKNEEKRHFDRLFIPKRTGRQRRSAYIIIKIVVVLVL